MIHLKQLVPEEVCLKCKGCCRFKEQISVWSPCLMDEEIQELVDKDIPSAFISKEKRLLPIPEEGSEGFICPFLGIKDNACKVYSFRPFECQLYPFLINLRDKKVILTVDLNCPYIKEQIQSQAFKEYADYLAKFLNQPQQLRILKENIHLLQAYEEVADIVELNF